MYTFPPISALAVKLATRLLSIVELYIVYSEDGGTIEVLMTSSAPVVV